MDVRRYASLDEALAGVEECSRCELSRTRTHVVPGAGNPHAKVVFIGEAPGRNEDLRGEPFVGSAGRLLDQMLERIGLAREDIYIANILKCRPPKNRDPRADEITACTPWLDAQLQTIAPEVFVTMGNFSTRFIMQTKESITQLRGRVHRTERGLVIPTFHPAAAIYDRSKIAAIESDFDLIKSTLESRGMGAATLA